MDAFILLHQGDGPLSRLLYEEHIPYQILPVKTLAGSSPNLFKIAIGVIRNLFKFSRFIRENGVDIVHGNDLRVNLSWSFPAKLCGKKFVWHQRTLLSSSPLWKFVPYLCSHFIGISKAVLSSAPSSLKDGKKTLALNPFGIAPVFDKQVEREFLHDEYGVPRGRLLVGYVGRLVDYKKLDFMLDCLSCINEVAGVKIHFIAIGDGKKEYIDQIRRKSVNLGMAGQVTFTGFVNNPEQMIAGLDLLVAASSVDAFGRSLVEAMLQKTPVLAASAGGHIEIVENGETGFLFTPDDRHDFTEKLCYLLGNMDLRLKLATNAYRHACERYSSDAHMEQIVSIYEQLLSIREGNNMENEGGGAC
jgi:glycosyltransferase involved in cell wall biosynthesis